MTRIGTQKRPICIVHTKRWRRKTSLTIHSVVSGDLLLASHMRKTKGAVLSDTMQTPSTTESVFTDRSTSNPIGRQSDERQGEGK
jgi:hypothetical protein